MTDRIIGIRCYRKCMIRCVLFFLTVSISLSAYSGENKPIKNVVVIIGDDQSTKTLGCYGNEYIKTPNLDKLAGSGIRFTHAYANSPICSPSRQSLLTGKYPQASGVTLLNTSFPASQLTIAEHLKALGFATGYVGKMHFNNNLPHGFDYRIKNNDWQNYLKSVTQPALPPNMEFRPPWRPFADPAEIWLNADMLPAPVYDTYDVGTYYARKANEFIAQNKDENFCLWVGFEEPHSPFNFPIEYFESYHPNSVPLPTGSPEDDRWIPAIFKNLTEQQRRGIIASYYTSVEYMDKNVGLILDKIDELGIADETLIIYLGDHGYLLNDHKRFEKHMMWEEAVGAPLIIKAGSSFTSGSTVQGLTEFVDLAPTIFDLLEVGHMDGLQGKSLIPLLNKEVEDIRDYVFSVYYADNEAMIRSRDYKYIFTTGKNDLAMGYATGLGAPGITHRFYDVNSDPEETTNLASHPEYSDLLRQFQDIMIQRFEETHPFASYIPKNLSVEEKLIWFCEPPETFNYCLPTQNYPDPMANEYFDYEPGKSLIDVEASGVNWKAGWENKGNLSSNKATVEAGSLSSQGLTDEGGKVKLEYHNNNTQIRIGRQLKYPIVSNDEEYWMSFYMFTGEVNAANNVANIMLTQSGMADSESQRIAFGRIYGSGKLGVVAPSENKSWISNIKDEGSNFFVIKLVTSCSNNTDSVYVWINPEKGKKPDAAEATLKLQTNALKKGIDGVMLKCEGAGSNQAPHTVFFDAISLAKTYESLTGSTTGIHSLNTGNQSFHIYPNPFQIVITIDFELNVRQNVEVKMVDINGKIALHKTFGAFNAGKHTIDLNISDNITKPLSPGFYMVQLQLGKETRSGKILFKGD